MKYLGLDFGTKKVGVATSDDKGQLAFPYTVLPAGAELINELRPLLEAEKIDAIVIGESRDYQRSPNPVHQKAAEFKQKLEEEFSVPVFWEDETLTTAQAERASGKHDKIDASAAALILQSYLDRHKH